MPEQPLTGALVRGFPAAVLAPILRDVLPARIAHLAGRAAAGHLDPAEVDDLRRTWVAIDQAADQWWAWRRGVIAGGSAAGSVTITAARSTEIDTDTAAAILGRTTCRVRQLIHTGHITAHRVGRVWLVDRESVELYREEAAGVGRRRTGPGATQSG